MSISSIESISIGLWFSFSFTLGNMHSTSRVSNISTSTGIETMDCRNSSRSNTMDTYSVGNIGDTITNCMVHRSSICNMSHTISMMTSISQMTSISKMSNTITKMSCISIRTIESISISLRFSLSLTLGNMHSTSRVGNIGDTITNCMMHRSSIGNMSHAISMMTSISQ